MRHENKSDCIVNGGSRSGIRITQGKHSLAAALWKRYGVLVKCWWLHDAGRVVEGTAGEACARLTSNKAAVSTVNILYYYY